MKKLLAIATVIFLLTGCASKQNTDVKQVEEAPAIAVPAENDTVAKADENQPAPENANSESENANPDADNSNEVAHEPDPEVITIKNLSINEKPFVAQGLSKAEKHIKLKVDSKKTSSSFDSNEWLVKNGFEKPKFPYSDGTYAYDALPGKGSEYDHEKRKLVVSDANGQQTIYDFGEVGLGEHYAVLVRYAMIQDDVLYVLLAHRGYASAFPDTGYMMALDLKGNIKWASKTLVANSNNFLIIDDTIVCGYGFTNEPDFVYTLDKNTGTLLDTIKVKSGPDYFIHKDNKIYVSTYDTEYIFSYK